MINLKNLVFLPTDFQLFFGKDVKPDEREKYDPKYVKIYGFVLDLDMNPRSCYLMEEFINFGLKKDDLISKLKEHCVIRSRGFLRQDKNYNQQLNFEDYQFGDSFDFSDLVTVEE